MKLDKYITTLAVEMTRRCNLNCNFCGKGIDIDFIKEYLRRCTTWDEEEINMISPEWCKGLINFLAEKYKNENEGENK